MEPLSLDLVWWVTAVEVPALAGLFWLIWRVRRDLEVAADRLRRTQEMGLFGVRESLASYKLEVAKSYVSIPYLKEVEGRLTGHLVRIENKLDNPNFANRRTP